MQSGGIVWTVARSFLNRVPGFESRQGSLAGQELIYCVQVPTLEKAYLIYLRLGGGLRNEKVGYQQQPTLFKLGGVLVQVPNSTACEYPLFTRLSEGPNRGPALPTEKLGERYDRDSRIPFNL